MNTSNDTTSALARSILDQFMSAYDKTHLPLVLTIGTIGILANLMNVRIFIGQAWTAVNLMLSSLAVCQLLFLLVYLLRTVADFFAFRDGSCSPLIFGSPTSTGYVLALINVNFALYAIMTLHVTCIVAIRYMVAKRQQSIITVTTDQVKKLIALMYIAGPVLSAPLYFASKVAPNPRCGAKNETETMYTISFRPGFYQVNLWYFAVCWKLIPCLVITVLNLLLIRELRRFQRRRNRIRARSRRSVEVDELARSAETVSRVLQTINVIFLLVELPQGLFNLFMAVVANRSTQIQTYSLVGPFVELITVVYTSVNFFLYCVTDRSFRVRLREICSRITVCNGLPEVASEV